MRLANAGDLTGALAHADAAQICFGHVHRAVATVWNAPPAPGPARPAKNFLSPQSRTRTTGCPALLPVRITDPLGRHHRKAPWPTATSIEQTRADPNILHLSCAALRLFGRLMRLSGVGASYRRGRNSRDTANPVPAIRDRAVPVPAASETNPDIQAICSKETGPLH
jgi:hypothetical protein